ncbi:MAG: flagellar basal-body rod protein FlgG [Planctomycetes bacterium]|nr:flagellar basal-body rod protein FlgG [Planctomycetota bacterium]
MHTATTGLGALSDSIDIIANNLANVNTNGFKRSRANFEDLLYLVKEPAGGENSQGVTKPLGTYVGLGTRISNTQRINTEGSLIQTNSPTDIAIRGTGYLQVKTFEDFGGGAAYTRNGNFVVNPNGELVMANSDGFRLEPAITIPDGYSNVSISSDGMVRANPPGETIPEELGQIMLYRFPNEAGLEARGMNLFTVTSASGDAVEGNPGTNGLGTTLGGFLESSNVDAVNELVNLIKAQRAFELNSQVITTGDQMLQTITRLK